MHTDQCSCMVLWKIKHAIDTEQIHLLPSAEKMGESLGKSNHFSYNEIPWSHRKSFNQSVNNEYMNEVYKTNIYCLLSSLWVNCGPSVTSKVMFCFGPKYHYFSHLEFILKTKAFHGSVYVCTIPCYLLGIMCNLITILTNVYINWQLECKKKSTLCLTVWYTYFVLLMLNHVSILYFGPCGFLCTLYSYMYNMKLSQVFW